MRVLPEGFSKIFAWHIRLTDTPHTINVQESLCLFRAFRLTKNRLIVVDPFCTNKHHSRLFLTQVEFSIIHCQQ